MAETLDPPEPDTPASRLYVLRTTWMLAALSQWMHLFGVYIGIDDFSIDVSLFIIIDFYIFCVDFLGMFCIVVAFQCIALSECLRACVHAEILRLYPEKHTRCFACASVPRPGGHIIRAF